MIAWVISEKLINLATLLGGSLVALYIIRRLFLSSLKRTQLYKQNDPYLHFAIYFIKKFFWSIYLLATFYLGVTFFVEMPSLKAVLIKTFIFLLTVMGIFMAQSLFGFLLETLIEKQKHDNPAVVNMLRFSKIFANILVWAIGILLVLGNLGYNVTSLITGLGIGGIAIALAVQNVLGDVINSFSIIFDKPFQLGDFIVVGSDAGTVEHIGIKTTRIRSLNGEEIIIPNTDLVKSRVQNFQKMERRRGVLNVGLVYETTNAELLRAKSIIEKSLTQLPNVTLDRIHVSELGSSSLNIEAVYFVESADFKVFADRREAALLHIKAEFEANHLEFAYPTQTTIQVNKKT